MGYDVGMDDGMDDGIDEGNDDGNCDGKYVGPVVCVTVGVEEGVSEGTADGLLVGFPDGNSDGGLVEQSLLCIPSHPMHLISLNVVPSHDGFLMMQPLLKIYSCCSLLNSQEYTGAKKKPINNDNNNIFII